MNQYSGYICKCVCTDMYKHISISICIYMERKRERGNRDKREVPRTYGSRVLERSL